MNTTKSIIVNKMTIEDSITEWEKMKGDLDYAKKRENDLRIDICEFLLKEESTGAHKYEYGSFSVTATKKVNRKLDAALLEAIYDDLPEDEKDCIAFKPSLIAAEYKEANTPHLDSCIITTDAMPTLSIKHDPIGE